VVLLNVLALVIGSLVKLVELVFERDSVHENHVETVVESVVDVVTGFAHFVPFADDSDCEVA